MAGLRFQSQFSPSKNISAAQYVTELVCKNNARKNGQDLPLKFWTIDSWNKFYKFQIKCCNDLLKIVDEEILISFVKQHNIWNLSAKWILESLEKLQRVHIASAKRKAEIILEQREREYVLQSKGLANKNPNLSYLD